MTANSAWYLTSIGNESETITLDYSTELEFDMEVSYGIEEISAYGSEFCESLGNLHGANPVIDTRSIIKSRHLTQISSVDMRAVFYHSRNDVPLDQMYPGQGLEQNHVVLLDSIHVYAMPGDVLIRSFHFDYQNVASQANGYLSRWTNRHFLMSVTEVGHDGAALPPYRFDYIDAQSLPGRLSTQQDAWGYGAMGGANPQSMSGGLIHRIEYPTGGSEEIGYEPNRLPSAEGPGGGLAPAFGGYVPVEAVSTGPVSAGDTFEVTAGDASWTTVYFTATLDPDPADAVQHYVEIDCGEAYQSGQIRDNEVISVPLDDGTECTITASAMTWVGGPYMQAVITAEWSIWVPPTPGASYGDIVGGLRVRERRSYPADGSEPLVREFFYVKDDNVTSSGIGRAASFQVPLDGMCQGYIRTVSAVSTVGSSIDVTYQRVEVHEGGSAPAGKTVYSFYQVENQPTGGTAGVFIPGALTNLDWQNSPTGHAVYQSVGNGYHLLLESSSSYGVDVLPWAPAFAVRIFPMDQSHYYVPYYSQYAVISGWMRVVEVEEIHYDTE